MSTWSKFAPNARDEWSAWRKRVASLRTLPAAAGLIWNSSRILVACDLTLRVVVAMIPVSSLWIAKLIIDQVAAAGGHPGPMTLQLWTLIGAEFALAALANLLNRTVDYCDGRIADEYSRGVSLRVIDHATRLDLAHFEDAEFQDLLARARLQATDRTEMLSDLGRFIQQAVGLLSLGLASVFLSPWLLLLVVGFMIPAFLTESHYAFRAYALAAEVTPMRREMDYLRELSTSRESIKEVKLFDLGPFLARRFDGVMKNLIRRNTKLARQRLAGGSVFAVLGSVGYYGAHAMLVAAAMRGAISLGTLTFLTGSLAAASGNVQGLFSLLSKIADQSLFLNDLFRFLSIQPAQGATPGEIAVDENRHAERETGIEFRNVSFRYPGNDRDLLRDVSFTIAPKERIAIVGANGQGKTTLVKLLSRLYDPTAGSILLNGIDIREYRLSALREQIGIIFQDFVRYEMTAAENVAVGRIDQLGDRPKLEEAAEQSGAEEIIARLPQGLSQMLGRRFEDGVDLSGGEWQRIALARAYLRRAKILVLDEPTAALDAQAEHEVFRKLTDLAEHRMVLLISHRFSTVRMADRILVLDDGEIREEGTHDDLISRGGLYAGMFELQAANYR